MECYLVLIAKRLDEVLGIIMLCLQLQHGLDNRWFFISQLGIAIYLAGIACINILLTLMIG
jgi:hypothetical protein